jgi:acyl carrier protein
MTSESTIATQIRTALGQHLKRDVSQIHPQDRLREDLGLDSLAMIELLFKIEEHFDLEIPNEDLSRVTTVADVTAYVEEKLGAKAAPAAAKAAPAMPAPVQRQAAEPAAKPAPPARLPAKVTSIKAAAKRKAAQASPKAAAKKKGSRRA